MEPAIFIQSLCSLLRVFQVALEHVFTLDTDLETSTRTKGLNAQQSDV